MFFAAVKSLLFITKLLPVNHRSYSLYIRQHYGDYASNLAFHYVKSQLKLNKLKCDLKFLKQCKKENLLPNFVCFHYAKSYNRHESIITKCYHQILRNEINKKKKELTYAYRRSARLKADLSININSLIFSRVLRIANERVTSKTEEWTNGHQGKLDLARTRAQKRAQVQVTRNKHITGRNSPPTPYNIEPIKNLSNKQLSKDEFLALSNGLDYVYPNKKINMPSFISNIETCFVNILGHCTNRPDYEEKDADEATTYNLTPIQLQSATKLRKICDKFCFDSSRQTTDRNANRMLNAVRNLRNDKTIHITKPDKGRGVVILDHSDYLSKMNEIVNDTNTFRPLDADPTIKEEAKLHRKLLALKASGFLSNEEYSICRRVGSQPARLYGLPKTHKDGIPLCPILSATGTFNYGVAKMLVNRLTHLRTHHTVISDTFSFVDQLHSLAIDMSKHKIVSFDVTSLFTNVPLDYTIGLIIEQIYGNHCDCIKNDRNKKRTMDQCNNCQNKINLKWLLDIATKGTHFSFNGNNYIQHNGVAMGSPLGPLLADIFLVHLEKQLMDELNQNGLIFWRRYVDDTFAIIEENTNPQTLLNILNSFHSSIQFTMESESAGSLSFLDINITRLSIPTPTTHSFFETSVYRKPTFTGLLTKFTSFIPIQYKRSVISSMAYRAIRICSSYHLLDKEFKPITSIALANGYPVKFIEEQIGTTLNKYFLNRTRDPLNNSTMASSPVIISSATTTTHDQASAATLAKKNVLLIDIPFVGRPSIVLGKKLINFVKQTRPDIKLQPIPRPPPSVQQQLPRKDPVQKHLQSHLVYQIQCMDCDATYIGKTIRHAITRHIEHGAPKHPCQPGTTTVEPPTLAKDLRRSSRLRSLKTKNTHSLSLDSSPATAVPRKHRSAIYEHQQQTNHSIDWSNWKIIDKDPHGFKLKIRESLAIQQHQPTLNRTMSSTPLIIFPEGLRITKPKVKIKCVRTK
ncbi:unnamed protein product [Adineta ricciae]|uniref:Reverse transcriptase domain-containing protein n=1 Tax=Adineta ricciae TaxID=249248 RepID=A0A816FCB4_ADIRI|nr:unnamed protein product [Adineta ricciae]